MRVALGEYAEDLMRCKYRLDEPGDRDPLRRGQTVFVEDARVVEKLAEFDEYIVQAAVEKSKDWFKKTLTEAEVRMRYKPTLFKRPEEENDPTVPMQMKFKVKCPGVQVPTQLSLHKGNRILLDGGSVEDLCIENTKVSVVASLYSIWFSAVGFGVAWQAESMIIHPGEARPPLSEFKFRTEVPIEAVVLDDVLSEKDAEEEQAPVSKRELDVVDDEEDAKRLRME